MYGSDVILQMILVFGLHSTARLRTFKLDISVSHSQVNVQVLGASDESTTDMTGNLRDKLSIVHAGTW